MKLIILLIFSLIKKEQSQAVKFIKMRIPNYVVSYCTFRMNYTHFYGCYSRMSGNVGTVLLVHSLKELKYKLSEYRPDQVIIVMPAEVFIKKSTFKTIMEKMDIIEGILILEPDYCMNQSLSICKHKVMEVPFFSEIDPCRDSFYRHFNQRACKFTDIFGFYGIYETIWPFPLVFVKANYYYQKSIIDCYHKFNAISGRKNKCKIQIFNYTPKPCTSASCILIENLLTSTWRFNTRFHYCSELAGNNIYITFNPSKKYAEKSIILITTRIDSTSLFDTASAGTQELYPSVSLLMFMAQLFNLTKYPPFSDVLLGFLDNESVDNLGSIRMIYDLKNNLVSNGVGNISDKNIVLIISIDDFILTKTNHLFAFIYECPRNEIICDIIFKHLKRQCYKYGFKLIIYNMNNTSDMWLKTINVPKIKFQSSVIDANPYKRSFLDRMKPVINPQNENFGRMLAEVVISAVNGILNDTFNESTRFSYILPDTISACFYDILCPLLNRLIGRREKNLYINYGKPLVSQAFVDGFVESKGGKYLTRLSYIISKLIIYRLRTSEEVDPNCLDMDNLNNFTMTVNDIDTCVHANIQIRTEFNPIRYVEKSTNFLKELSDLPISMRSNIVQQQKLELFVSSDSTIDITSTILATLLSALSFVISIFVYRNINNLIAQDIF